jgi:hypothetical protein
LAKTTKDLKQKTTELTQTEETLKATTAEKDKAVVAATTQGKRATQLADELNTTKKARDDAQAEVAQYKASGMNPEQVVNLSKTLKQAQDDFVGQKAENLVLNKKIDKLQATVDKYTGGQERIVYLPANLKGQVMVSDPKWDFVVLNVGENQQVVEDGEFLVNRNGKLVAKVKVTNVQKDRSVANVIPGWRLGEILEGDQVIPAHPAS